MTESLIETLQETVRHSAKGMCNFDIVDTIFSCIPPVNRFCVEFGAARHGPTWQLRHRDGWNALLMDAKDDARKWDRAIVPEYVSSQSINEIFERHGVPSFYDFLVIDIDSNEYWVWQAIEEDRFRARVVCIEFNCFFPPRSQRFGAGEPCVRSRNA